MDVAGGEGKHADVFELLGLPVAEFYFLPNLWDDIIAALSRYFLVVVAFIGGVEAIDIVLFE